MLKGKKSTHSSELSSSSGSSSSLSSDEETDAQDSKPIKDYMADRKELASQLFKSVKPEKIRMMLPQVLKKVNLSELEELCANELSGMSRARITCILSGKDMIESSNTSESGDSGPSLEIISDTEEWFSEDDTIKKDEGTSRKVKSRKEKLKGKAQMQKKNIVDRLKVKGKPDSKDKEDKHKGLKIKLENENEGNKEKEGDSLLDLLELEMRARAIRALIRKEEDIIPNVNSSKTISNDSAQADSTSKAAQEELKQKEKCRRQIEKFITAQHAEDEDVVLVVEPTPTIELISSDSDTEGHGGARVNKKLENERKIVVERGSKYKNEASDKSSNKGLPMTGLEEGQDEHTSDKDSSESRQEAKTSHTQIERVGEKRRKSHKRPRVKDRDRIKVSKIEKKSKPKGDDTEQESQNSIHDEHSTDNVLINDDEKTNAEKKLEQTSPAGDKSTEEKKPDVRELRRKESLDEEKSVDMEEIIDLDDYSDDMEDIENYGSDKAKDKQEELNEQKTQSNPSSTQKSTSAETWASRYYQTEDVQSVIKESKIQSEIRKRLRERQRLSKLSKSPNTSTASSAANETSSNASRHKPTGSVDEYLALKRAVALGLNSEKKKDDVDIPKDSTPCVTFTTSTNIAIEENCAVDTTLENKLDDKQVHVNSDANAEFNSTPAEALEIQVNNDTNFT